MFVNGVERMGKSLTNTIILVVSVNKYLPSTFCLQSLGLELGAVTGVEGNRHSSSWWCLPAPSLLRGSWVMLSKYSRGEGSGLKPHPVERLC